MNMYTGIIDYVYIQDIYVHMYAELCIHARLLGIHVYIIMYTCKMIMYTCILNYIYMQGIMYTCTLYTYLCMHARWLCVQVHLIMYTCKISMYAFIPNGNIFRVTGHLVPGEFPTQTPVTRSFDVFFDLRLNKWLSEQSWGWWFETLSCPSWRHCNVSIHIRIGSANEKGCSIYNA